MGRFKGEYAIKGIGPYLFKTLAELSYTTKKGVTHTVPVDFVTDGASIPRIFWSFIGSPFTGFYRRPSLIHDELYATQKFKRIYADRVFLEGMEDEGVSFWKRRLIYLAVRLRGWVPWNKHKRKRRKEIMNTMIA